MSEFELTKWIGGRKFIVTLISQLLGGVLLWFGKIDAVTFQMILIWVVSAYITGNVTQSILTK